MYTTVTFMGRDGTANAEDELPIKNHLPADLGASFRTLNQWLNRGFAPKADAVEYRMHPSVMARRTYIYFYESDVEDDCGRCPAESASYLNEKQVVESALKQSTGSGGLTAIGMKGLMD